MNKIVSNFYLIRLDGEPVYVGYTNRSIKQRFSEHKRSKDFGDTEQTVESLGSLEYDFTWDEELINSYSREVSARETELILAYNTKDTIWQKGTSGSLGGQTWANVKYFIRTNRNNPKFRGLPEEAILSLIEYQRKMVAYLKSVINNTKPLEDTRLKSVINNTKPLEELRLKSVINNTMPLEYTRLKNVISHTKPLEDTRLKSVINNTKPLEELRLKSIINDTKPLDYTRLKSVINGAKPPEYTRLKSVITHTNPLEATRLNNVIKGTRPLEEVRLRNAITHTKPIEDNRLKNVISHTKPLEETRLRNVISHTKRKVANNKNL